MHTAACNYIVATCAHTRTQIRKKTLGINIEWRFHNCLSEAQKIIQFLFTLLKKKIIIKKQQSTYTQRTAAAAHFQVVVPYLLFSPKKKIF